MKVKDKIKQAFSIINEHFLFKDDNELILKILKEKKIKKHFNTLIDIYSFEADQKNKSYFYFEDIVKYKHTLYQMLTTNPVEQTITKDLPENSKITFLLENSIDESGVLIKGKISLTYVDAEKIHNNIVFLLNNFKNKNDENFEISTKIFQYPLKESIHFSESKEKLKQSLKNIIIHNDKDKNEYLSLLGIKIKDNTVENNYSYEAVYTNDITERLYEYDKQVFNNLVLTGKINRDVAELFCLSSDIPLTEFSNYFTEDVKKHKINNLKNK